MPKKTSVVAVAACAAISLLLGASCAQDGRRGAGGTTSPPADTGRAGRESQRPSTTPVAQRPHWEQSKELQGVMQQLAGLRGAVPSAELPQDVESPAGREAATALATAAALGEALADTAVKIPAAARSRPLREADRRAFEAVARTLHDQAIEVRDAARARKVERVQGLIEGMNWTCLSCHSRFRDFAGELEFRKADGASPSRGVAVAAHE
jgi:cytochrome c556